MTAITEANAKKLIRALPFFRQMSKHGKIGWYKFLTNFDDTTGAYSGAIADTDLTAITGDSLTIASGETDGTFVLSVNTTGTNHAVTLKAPVTTQAVTLTLPDVASDTLVSLTATQTLTNKTLTTPTLTTPVIASFASAQHNHSNAAGGGTISVPDSLTGTSATTFTIGVGGTIPKAAISVLGSTGDYTATLQIPVLAASRTITFPAVTCTLASITGTETLTNKTLTSPVIGTGLTASGNAANSFAGSTGTFLTSTGAVTIGNGAVGITGAVTMATTKGITFGAAAAGTATPITAYSLTANKGAIILAVTDSTTDHATTITNSALNGAAATITLPASTCTLPGVGLANTFTAVQTVAIDDASNTSVTDVLSLRHTTSGASGAGIGAGISVIIENDTDATTENATIEWIETSDGTKASLDTDVVFSTMLGGTVATALTIDASAQEVVIGADATNASGMHALRIWPLTASKGSILIQPTDNTGDDTITITNGNTHGDITITLPTVTSTLAILGANTFTAAQAVTSDDTTDGIVNLVTLTHSSSDNAATAADGIGISFQLENATGTSTVEEWASLDVVSTTITNGSEDGDVVISVMAGGTVVPALTIDSSDQSVTVGANSTDADGISSVRIFPVTASKGSLVVTAVANTAGDFATTLTSSAANPATVTTTLPAKTGQLYAMAGTATTSAADSDAIPLTHGIVAKTTAAIATSLTLANGEPGQELMIYLAVDGGGAGTLTPTTTTGFTDIVFDDAGDQVVLRYIDDTIGWIILSATGVAAPPAITA